MSAAVMSPEAQPAPSRPIPQNGQKLTKPAAINVFAVGIGLIALFAGQVFTGTTVPFAMLVTLFLILSSTTLWLLGGLRNILGLSVFTVVMQHVLVACVAKVFAGQGADAPEKLLVPMETMAMYCTGMGGLLAAALVFRLFRLDRWGPIVKTSDSVKTLKVVGLFCLGLGVVQALTVGVGAVGERGGVITGGIFGPLKILAFLTPVAIAALTAAVVLETNGRRMIGFLNSLALITPTVFGLLGATRQATATAFIVLFITAWAYGFRFKVWHFAVLLAMGFVFEKYITPYIFRARDTGGIRSLPMDERPSRAVEVFFEVIESPDDFRKKSEIPKDLDYWEKRLIYHDGNNNTLTRYSVMPFNDTIVYGALQNGFTGWHSTWWGFQMVLPSFAAPDKPVLSSSNWVAHHGKGLVNKGDYTTGITLGFFIDAFLSFGWIGCFFGCFIIGLSTFVATALCFRTSIDKNYIVAGLLFWSVWIFSEGTIQAQVLFVLQTLPITGVFMLIVQWLANSATTSSREFTLRKVDTLPEEPETRAPVGASSK